MKRVLERKTTKFLNESISFAYPPILKKKLWAQLKTYLVSSAAIVKWKRLAKNFNFLGHWLCLHIKWFGKFFDISSLVPWFECVRHLTRNSIICRFFMDLNWITSSSLLNVISTIAWVWESLAFGHNDWNLIDSNSIC